MYNMDKPEVVMPKLMEEHEDLLKNHEDLKLKWSKKSALLASLEEKIVLIDKAGKREKQQLVDEKNTALDALSFMKKRMENIDDEIKQQLDVANAAHLDEMKRLERNRQTEVDHLKKKVQSVENEMRHILQESEAEKKKMENKLNKIKKSFIQELNLDV